MGDFSLTPRQLRPHLPEIDALLAGGERMTPDLFAIAPNLRVIARTGVGYDLIDVAAASAHKVAVTITPGTNQDSVAEQTLALLLALPRRIVHNDRVIHSGGWDRALVTPVRGMTLGLIGMGRIGRAVAIRALAFQDAGRRVRHRPSTPNSTSGTASNGCRSTSSSRAPTSSACTCR